MLDLVLTNWVGPNNAENLNKAENLRLVVNQILDIVLLGYIVQLCSICEP